MEDQASDVGLAGVGREKRVRSLTSKGQEFNEDIKNTYLSKLQRALVHMDSVLQSSKSPIEGDTDYLPCELQAAYHEYEIRAKEYMDFLARMNTEESLSELAQCQSTFDIKKKQYKEMTITFQSLLETTSVSHGSSRSRASTIGSVAARKRAKAEALKTRAVFARKEYELLKQKAALEEHRRNEDAKAERMKMEVEAELLLLAQEKDAAAFDAEASILEIDEDANALSVKTSPSVKLNLPSQSKNVRTVEYISNLDIHQPVHPEGSLHRQQNVASQIELSPYARDFTPKKTEEPKIHDLTRFLLKKDLMLSRLSHFNEQPETFEVWRSSFSSIMRDLEVSPQEELDLLVKHLGPESSKYAMSLRASNPCNPERGLRLLWERLEERYGSPELVESCLKTKLENFPLLTYKDSRKFYELCDILDEINCAKENPKLRTSFAVYDSSVGVNSIISKLPQALRQKWVSQAAAFKKENCVPFPPFAFVVDFIRNMSKIQNDPAFRFDKKDSPAEGRRHTVINRKTEINKNGSSIASSATKCPIHKTQHSLAVCKAFSAKSWTERKAFLKDNNLCFKCLSSTEHNASKCTAAVTCEKCGKKHITAMHREGYAQRSTPAPTSPEEYGGEGQEVSTKCTTLCQNSHMSRSCGKIVKVKVFPTDQPEKGILIYAILDDQSNRSLATPAVMDCMGCCPEEIVYTLTSCSGTSSMSGRQIQSLNVQSLDGQVTLKLPLLMECSKIPDDRSEIPTPDVAKHHRHLNRIAKNIPFLDQQAPIGLLIGRDLPEAHHVLDQILGPPMSPFAQRLPLGWVVVGDVCLSKMHKPSVVHVSKTSILHNGRGTIFEPCPYKLKIIDTDQIHSGVFEKTAEDEKIGMSVEDKKFLALMDQQFHKNEEDRWSAPLPLRSLDPIPRNNRSQCLKRAYILDATMKKNHVKREHLFKFMSNILDSGFAEQVPLRENVGNTWYLPLFGVYHPKKPDKIRGVFDSSATFEGHSLNDMLLSGPDLTNSLVGILLRFRRDKYAIIGDIEQMFYQFFVDKHHRDLLRFFWYQDNDFSKPLVEYRMCVHVFGNSPSPAVATYGLRKTVSPSAEDVKNFVFRNFYVDDGVTSSPEKGQAVSLMQRTQAELMKIGNLRLHKIASNDRDILKAFPTEDLCPELQTFDLSDRSVPLPVHSCLGLPWNLETDVFEIGFQLDASPFTRRGILSTLNSIFDPHGFLAPLVTAGKILLREICHHAAWDEPLPAASEKLWEQWKKSLELLSILQIPRMIVPVSLSSIQDMEIHIFCDASEKAIAAVAYAKVFDGSNDQVGFIIGKSKVAPSGGHTIPRLELCSAVLATELYQLISEQLDIVPKSVTFYTDSKVVLGYINNETRRFYTYVSNRVERIRRVSDPVQWQHVPTEHNPADAATRCAMENLELKLNIWLRGPREFLAGVPSATISSETHLLVSPDVDVEVRPTVRKTDVTAVSSVSALISRFVKYSSWDSLVKALCLLRHVCRSFHSPEDSCKNWHYCSHYRSIENLKTTEKFIFQTVQFDAFAIEIQNLRQGNQIPKSSSILSLSPYLDEDGLLRVGGRLLQARQALGLSKVNPIILPKNHHVSILVIRHYHQKIEHQGRHFTEGAVRSEGFWIVGAKRLVASVIQQCFSCKRLRGKQACQQMASLPADRVLPSAPFSHVGVDVFGPWPVIVRKTRSGLSSAKRWAVIFTCMAIRAIHIEVIEEMSSSSFINALRRFISLRGPIKELRSDRGTNFIGAAGTLRADAIFVETGPVREHLLKTGITWRFNPPHASHMGGSWERLIGVTRRILDAMFLDKRRKPLTHEVLCTLMAEICAIVNSRPIVPISCDPDSPLVLTPSMLLTMKSGQTQVPCDSSDMKEVYKHQWKHVQILSNTFWKQWKEEYLQSLQQRCKWQSPKPNIKEGGLVLLRDSGTPRYNWPIGLVTRTFPSEIDSLVRSVQVRVISDQKAVNYIRPITELFPL